MYSSPNLLQRWGIQSAVSLLCICLIVLLPAASLAADVPPPFQGSASWYGVTAHGRMTASGRIFNRVDYAAAHRTLPFGTVLRVHNINNNKHVLVVVNDRGPFVRGRVVDVSLQAAKMLGFVPHGVAPVWCEVVSTQDGEPLHEDQGFYVQLFAVPTWQAAEQHQRDIALRLGLSSKIFHAPDDPVNSYRVCAGYWPLFSEAETVLETLPAYYDQAKVILAPRNSSTLPPSILPDAVQDAPAAPAKKAALKKTAKKKRSAQR